MHHRGADPQLRQLAEDLRRVALARAACAAPGARDRRTAATSVRISSRRRLEAQRRAAAEPPRRAADRPRRRPRKSSNDRGLDAAAAQQLEQQLATARPIRRRSARGRGLAVEMRLELGGRMLRARDRCAPAAGACARKFLHGPARLGSAIRRSAARPAARRAERARTPPGGRYSSARIENRPLGGHDAAARAARRCRSTAARRSRAPRACRSARSTAASIRTDVEVRSKNSGR